MLFILPFWVILVEDHMTLNAFLLLTRFLGKPVASSFKRPIP